MKLHYFEQLEPDQDDWELGMAKQQGYVPGMCLLGGAVVMCQINKGKNPCWGCNGPREKCKGTPKREES
jgi:hypothetical protein